MKGGINIKLSDFKPKSELVVKETIIVKPKFPVIDCHLHFGPMALGQDYENKYVTGDIIAKLKEFGICHAISPDLVYGEDLDRYQNKISGYEDFIAVFASIDMSRVFLEGFEDYVHSTIKQYSQSGVRGLKFWKNLSLEIKDDNGLYLRLDDLRLKPIWKNAADYGMPIIIHVADPTAFFKPITNSNERIEELGVHPEWSFYGDGRFTFEELMQMQENLLRDNPDTIFIVAHVGSYSENLESVSKMLDSYPNMMIDTTERISELGRQPYTARKFLTKYQDRILFGTDYFPTKDFLYPIYYRFFETYDEYFDYDYNEIPSQGRWKIYGVGLDDIVLEKIYNRNARRILKIDAF